MAEASKQVSGSGNRATGSPYEIIREAILDGTFGPGEKLVEVDVARFCGVSRTPIREAFTRLEQDGLLERDPRGLHVKTRSPEEILDIYETRIPLEAAAAKIAAQRHTPYDIKRLKRQLEIGEEANFETSHDVAKHNAQFHRAIWAASHNPALIDLLNRLVLHLGRYPETTLAYPGRISGAHVEHRDIVDAIEKRDDLRAGELAAAHYERARDIRLELWSEASFE